MNLWMLVSFLKSAVLSLWRHGIQRNRKIPRDLAIFISGCDSGIGQRLAMHFCEIGCHVYAGCLDPDTAGLMLPESVCVIPLDVTKEQSVQDALDMLRTDLKRKKQDLWALVNNAGVCVFGQFEWQTWKQCQQQIEVNVLGTIRLTKAFIPLLRSSKGRLITVTSINGTIAYPGLSIYSATKFFLEGLNDSLRLELGQQHDIRVITVRPGDYARITSIMSRHQQNAQEMWDAMSSEDQHQYGDFFHKYHRITLKNYGLSSPDTFEGSDILRDMEDAVLSEVPADKYTSTPMVYRLLYKLMALLPTRYTDYILSKIMEIVYRYDDKGNIKELS